MPCRQARHRNEWRWRLQTERSDLMASGCSSGANTPHQPVDTVAPVPRTVSRWVPQPIRVTNEVQLPDHSHCELVVVVKATVLAGHGYCLALLRPAANCTFVTQKFSPYGPSTASMSSPHERAHAAASACIVHTSVWTLWYSASFRASSTNRSSSGFVAMAQGYRGTATTQCPSPQFGSMVSYQTLPVSLRSVSCVLFWILREGVPCCM